MSVNTDVLIKLIQKPRAVASICITWKDDSRKEVALIKRLADYPHHLSGQWFFPGGGVEQEEHPCDAAAREVLEECGITVCAPKLVDVHLVMERWKDEKISYSQPIILCVYEAIYEHGILDSVNV